MSKNKNKPEIVKLTSKNIDEITVRLHENSLSSEDKKIISTILITYQWLCRQLQTAKFSIRKLKSIFGFKTEKRANLPGGASQDTANTASSTENTEEKSASNNSEQLPAKK